MKARQMKKRHNKIRKISSLTVYPAFIISAILIVGFSLILNKCSSCRIIKENTQDSRFSYDSGNKTKNSTKGTQGSISGREPLPDSSKGKAIIITEIKNICQMPELPTGCEVTALTAALKFYGLDAEKEELAYTYLPKEELEASGGIKYGADPMVSFVGDPFSQNGYGAMSEVIETAANAYLKDCGSTLRAKALRNTDLSFFLDRLMQGEPSLVWVTTDMKESYISDSWLTKDGRQIYWQANEHCVALAGYDRDKGVIYCADPLKDTQELTAYDSELFTARFFEMGAQGVIFE